MAQFLRREAAAVSLTVEMTGRAELVGVGLGLLDAAALALRLPVDDPVLERLALAGCFEPLPGERVRFVSTAAIQQAILHPLPATGGVADALLRSIVVAAGSP